MGSESIRGKLASLVACAAFVPGGLLGCGDAGKSSSSVVASARDCKRVRPQKTNSASYKAPEQTVRRGEKLSAEVKTSCGTFRIALDAKRWPTTVNSFVFLVEEGFYDGLVFDRAAQRTYVHGGKARDADGPGYRVQGEVPPNFTYREGIVAMSQPVGPPTGTVGSEFFIVVASPWLDFTGIYAPLGKVEEGLDVVERISLLGPSDGTSPGTGNIGTTGTIGKLRRPVLIESISIDRSK